MISIRRRLTLLLCLAIGGLFIATGLGVFLAMRELLQRQFDETLTAKARAIITASEIDDGDFEIDLTVQDFAGFGSGGDDYFEIRRRDGRLFMKSPSLEGAGFRITLDPRAEAPRDDFPRLFPGTLGDGRSARFYVQHFRPKDDKKQRFRDLHLVVASPNRGMHLQLALLATVLGVAGGTALVTMVPLIRLGLRGGLKPLDRLSADVKAIRPESLDQRLDPERLPVELAPVATGLNEWLGRLEASFERERRFSSHVAHELRTPLSELRGLAEVGSMWPDDATPQRCAEIVKVADELQALLDKLTLLARADAGREPVLPEATAFVGSIETALTRLAPLAAKRRIRIESDLVDGPFISDPALWTTIVQNLLGNAISHAPQGSTVTVRAKPGSLRVRNLAPDLSPDDLDHLFERFWRKDASHSGYEHSGLGLSIARACTELLGGKLIARLDRNGFLEVSTSVPDTASHD